MGMNTNSPIFRACDLVGGATKLAALLGVHPVVVYEWRTGKRPVPFERCITIDRLTNGQIRCEDLRPDIDWGYLRASADEKV